MGWQHFEQAVLAAVKFHSHEMRAKLRKGFFFFHTSKVEIESSVVCAVTRKER